MTPMVNKFNLSSIECEVLVAYAKSGLIQSKAAKLMYMNSSSVIRYLNKIHKKTGIDPKNFFGLACLLNAKCVYQENACFIVYDGGNERIEFKNA